MNSLRTKQALAESLKKLPARKDFQEISVGGIAAGCGLSRNTFYYHFRDKYDLANWIFHSETAVLFTDDLDGARWGEMLNQLCDYLQQNCEFYSNVLRYTGQNSLYEAMFDRFSRIFYQRIHQTNGPACARLSEGELSFMADFFSAAFMGLLTRWISNGMKTDPALFRICMERLFASPLIEDYVNSVEPSGMTDQEE